MNPYIIVSIIIFVLTILWALYLMNRSSYRRVIETDPNKNITDYEDQRDELTFEDTPEEDEVFCAECENEESNCTCDEEEEVTYEPTSSGGIASIIGFIVTVPLVFYVATTVLDSVCMNPEFTSLSNSTSDFSALTTICNSKPILVAIGMFIILIHGTTVTYGFISGKKTKVQSPTHTNTKRYKKNRNELTRRSTKNSVTKRQQRRGRSAPATAGRAPPKE